METLGREMSRLMPWAESSEGQLGIPVDVYETDDEVVVKAEVPGIKKEDLEINLQDSTLTIRGHTQDEQEIKEESFYRHEVRCGSFYRAVALPSEVKRDKVKASCEEGVCTIHLPKAKGAQAGTKVAIS